MTMSNLPPYMYLALIPLFIHVSTSLPAPTPAALTLLATCDDDLEVFVDGAPKNTSTKALVSLELPVCPSVIAVSCHDQGFKGGIYASITNADVAYVTDQSWKCRSYDDSSAPRNWNTVEFDDSDWSQATELPSTLWSGDSNNFPDIKSSGAEWIWTNAVLGKHRKVHCRKSIPGCGLNTESTTTISSTTTTHPPTTTSPTTTTTSPTTTTTSPTTTTTSPTTTTASPTTTTTTPKPTTTPTTTPSTTPSTTTTTTTPTTKTPTTTTPTTTTPTTTPHAGGYNCQSRNPCIVAGNTGKTHHPHETATRFIMCTPSGRCHVKKCRRHLVWSDDVSTCVRPEPTPPVRGDGGYSCQHNNPCDAESHGQYFPHISPSKFIQCAHARCDELSCPAQLVWSETIRACVFP